MHAQKIIEKLGYSKKEAKIYLTSLQLGACTISNLAKTTGIPRTSIQVIVERLHDDGLMNFFIQRQHKCWSAENPEKLLVRLKENETSLRTILPRLTNIKNKTNKCKLTVKIFTNLNYMRLIHEDIISTKHHLCGIITCDEWLELEGNRDGDFTETRIKNFLNSQLIVIKTSRSIKLKEENKKELQHIKFLPASFLAENTILIYGNKVAFISINKKLPTAVLVEAPDVHDMMLMFFKDLWVRSEE